MILDYGRVLLKYEEEEEEWVGWQCSPTWEVTYPEKEKRKKEKGRRKSDLSSLKFKGYLLLLPDLGWIAGWMAVMCV